MGTGAFVGTLASPALAQVPQSRFVLIQDERRLPTYRQPDQTSCGPTCCRMVLAYYGIPAGVSSLKTAAGTRWIQVGNFDFGMSLPFGLVRALNQKGLPSQMARMGDGLQSVRNLIDQNRPPILLVRSGPETWHYIVVIGYDPVRDFYRIVDPAGDRPTIPGATLDLGWTFNGNYRTGQRYRVRCWMCGGSGRVGGFSYFGGQLKSTGERCPTCLGSGNLDGPRRIVESVVSARTLIMPHRAPAGTRPRRRPHQTNQSPSNSRPQRPPLTKLLRVGQRYNGYWTKSLPVTYHITQERNGELHGKIEFKTLRVVDNLRIAWHQNGLLVQRALGQPRGEHQWFFAPPGSFRGRLIGYGIDSNPNNQNMFGAIDRR